MRARTAFGDQDLKRFSIITACKGRLEHVKQSLPRMVAQDDAEVIVVDYSCPEGTGDYVEQNFPGVRVVRVAGEDGFSNWKARNRGAAVATGQLLVFCDADAILAESATAVIAQSIPQRAYGFFTRNATARFNRSKLRLSTNQLRGFQVVPAGVFRKMGGYDEVLSGYAAGGDTDLEERLALFGFKGIKLGDGIIDDVVEHDNAARFTFHREPIRLSYAAGLLYRRAKITLIKGRKKGLTLVERKRLYALAQKAAAQLGSGQELATMQVKLEEQPVGMPRQLGFEEGRCIVSIDVRLKMQTRIAKAPD